METKEKKPSFVFNKGTLDSLIGCSIEKENPRDFLRYLEKIEAPNVVSDLWQLHQKNKSTVPFIRILNLMEISSEIKDKISEYRPEPALWTLSSRYFNLTFPTGFDTAYNVSDRSPTKLVYELSSSSGESIFFTERSCSGMYSICNKFSVVNLGVNSFEKNKLRGIILDYINEMWELKNAVRL